MGLVMYSNDMNKKKDLVSQILDGFDNNFAEIFNNLQTTNTTLNKNYSIKNGEKQTVIEIEMPGTKASDVEVSHLDGIVTVSWKSRGKSLQEKFRVEKELDVLNAQAKVEDGLFTLFLDRVKPEVPKSNKIPVK